MFPVLTPLRSYFLAHLHLHKGSPHLDASIQIRHLQVEKILIPDEGTEFRFVVVNVKPILVHFYFGVVPRYRDVRYSDLALMSPPQLYAFHSRVSNQHHTFRLLASGLQDHIISLWFFYWQ